MRQITLPAVMFDTLEGRLYQGNFAHEFGSAPITLGDVMLHREEERAGYTHPPERSGNAMGMILILSALASFAYAAGCYFVLS